MRTLKNPTALELTDDLIVEADNAHVLPLLPDGAFDLIYIDPPFNTGRRQRRDTLAVIADKDGDRTGFGGRRYRSQLLRSLAYDDVHGDYLAFLAPRLEHARRLLAPQGTLYFHIDYREAHYCKLLLDEIFGRDCFLNEIIWAYDFGGKPKRRWPAKHDTILVYVKDPTAYHFDSAAVEREPYMAPGLVTEEQRANGKLPTDCYSSDTEILTAQGWLPFPALSSGIDVASVGPDGDIVFSTPTKIHARRYTGSLVHLKTKTIDLLVTPSHSLYGRPKHAAEPVFLPTSDLTDATSANWYIALPNRFEWGGQRPPAPVEVPPVRYDRPYCAKALPTFAAEDWCELLGWYLAEGCTTFYADRSEVHIAQQKRPERVRRIGRLLETLGLRAHYNGRCWVISNKQLATYLRTFGKAHEKRLPREILDLPRGCLERLYAGLLLGDGYRRIRRVGGNAEEIYTTVSPGLADDVQELMLRLGWNATITRAGPAAPTQRPRYTVSRRASAESTIWPARHASMVPYDGTVHCATVVPHHTLIVRRNGRAAVCGNCWWHTIVPTSGAERTGYPTQKPEGIVRRIVSASSRPGAWCLDFFAGSGTLGAVCQQLGRRFVLVDSSPDAVLIARERLARRRAAPRGGS